MWLKRIALFSLYFYQSFLRGILGGSCRFTPSCSEYAVEAYQNWPPETATPLVIKRLCRCHPFGSSGWDPVPLPAKEICAHESA